MTKEEAIEIIRMAIAKIEWEYSMNYSAAFDMAIESLSQPEIVRCKDCIWNAGTKENPYCQIFSMGRQEEFFCANGKRCEVE